MWYIIYRLSIFLVVAFQLCVCLLLIKTHPHVFGRILFPIFHIFLVGGLEHFILCHILWTSSSQLTFIFFKGVSIPPTRYKQMVPKITPYMVPYITPFVYHHFCWLSPMICWTVTLDRHVTIPGVTRRSHRGLISEKIAREGFRNVKTEESNEDTQRISWNLSNVWLVFVYIYIYGFMVLDI